MRKIFYFQRKQGERRGSTVNKAGTVVTKADLMIKSQIGQVLKYFLGGGNNNFLVRRVLSTRKGWVQVNDSRQTFLNLKWQQSNKGYKYQNCIDNRIFKHCLNHFQYHYELSNKEYLFRNLLEYCQNNKLNVFQYVPITFILNILDSDFHAQQDRFIQFYNQNNPRLQEQKNKNLLAKERQKDNVHIVTRNKSNNQNLTFQRRPKTYHAKYQIPEQFHHTDGSYLWILKPTSYNRGNGIHVFTNLLEMESLINRYIQGQNKISGSPDMALKKSFRIRQPNQMTIRSSSFVVQKYLQQPLLFDNRKFDIRVWVLLNHEMKVYLFKQGYMRTSSTPYETNPEKAKDLSIHLTNNAVQKYGQQYGKFQPGNQLSFKCLKALIQNNKGSYEKMIEKMKNMIKISMLSVRKKINKIERSYCFQIFGYDFMLDKQCNPWLIEVNTNPCIQQSSPLLQQLLPRMLDDAFALTIDQIFEIPKTTYSYPIQGESNSQNLWQIIVDLKTPDIKRQ